jgi:hypothetical protein
MKPKTLAFIAAMAVTLSLGQTKALAQENLENIRHSLASPIYEARVDAVTELLRLGLNQPLNKAAIDLLLPALKRDDWRIKVRILLVLPFSANHDWVIQPLIESLCDREEESSGSGNVPSGACKALARLDDERGLKPCEDWLQFLWSHPKAYGNLHGPHVDQAKKYIAELKRRLEKKGSNWRGGPNRSQPSGSEEGPMIAVAASRLSL